MATNTGSNGGKNNTGQVRAGSNIDQSSGLNSAFNQANYRREYNEKMFSDSGYLNSSIKDLQAQAKELDAILEKSRQLTQAEKTRFSKMSADMKKLAAEQNEMFTKQEASSKELQSTLNESSKMRLKAVDELYQQYMKKEKDLNDAGRRQVENKIRQFAAASREIKADVEDINEATKNFENAKKSLSDGIGEFVDNIQSGLSDFIKTVSLQNLSSNEFLDKANERYKIMNKINSQLGYDASESTRTYNSLISSFNSFNENMGNLFSLDDLNQYIQDSNNLGIHNEQILRDTLQQSVIASKYLGLSVDTQSSLFKYMKLTNSNDMIANYNKTMVALQKRHIGVSEDMLDQLVMNGTEVNDVLTAAGADVSKWNSGQQAFAGVLSDKGYTDDQIKQLTNGLNEAIINLTTTSGIGQLAQMGINPQAFKAAVQSSDYTKAMEMFVNGNNRMSSIVGNDISASGFLREQLGLNLGVTNTTSAVGEDLEGIKDAVNNVLKDKDSMTEDDVKDAIENNKQQTWVQGAWNWLQGKVEEIFGGSGWLNFETLGTAAFAAYLASSIFKGGKIIVDAFKSGGFFSKLFSSFFGKGSTLATGAESSTTLAAGGGKLGSVLGSVAAVGGGVLLAAGAGSLITDAIRNARNEDESSNVNQYTQEMKDLGASDAFANASGKIGGVARSGSEKSGFLHDFGQSWSQTWDTLGFELGKITDNMNASDKTKHALETLKTTMDIRNESSGTQEAMLWTFAYLADSAGVLDAVSSDLGGINRDDLKTYLRESHKDESYFDKMIPYLESNFADIDGVPSYPWKSKDDQQTFINWDHYHLAGLNRVPRDGYRALLHKDEMILNKNEAQRYRAMFGKRGYGFGGSLNASAPDYVGAHHAGYAGHNGIDLYFGEIGTPVGSAVAGKVLESKDIPVDWNDGKSYHGTDSNGTHYSSYGRVVKVKGDDGHTYIYAHLNERAVKAGDQVGAGTLLGYSGTTGNSSGPHLHFEVAGAGTGEAAHAKYYTPYVRSANGAAAQTGVADISSGDTNSEGVRRGALLASVNSSGVRAIPGFGGGSNSGPSSTDRIVNSVDGVSTKIIKYLDEIRQEQADQRRLINAFSASQTGIQDYR